LVGVRLLVRTMEPVLWRSLTSSKKSSPCWWVNSRKPKSSRISRSIRASLRSRCSQVWSAWPPASSASSRLVLAKVTLKPRRQGKPPQHVAEQQVERSQGHAPIIAARQPSTNSQLSTHDRISGTHRPGMLQVCGQ
jgi:hypothetical protein